MDPNATLKRIREMFAQTSDWTSDDAQELEMLVRALDEWLSGGGFLPDAWAANRTAPASDAGDPTGVTEADAQAVRTAVMTAFNLTAEDQYAPVVRRDDDAPEGHPVTWVLLWEDGPDDWPFSEAPTREELPANVWVEPINHYSLRILPRT